MKESKEQLALKELIYDMVNNIIRDNLRIDVGTKEVYIGGMSGRMYKDEKIIKLYLNDTLISETYI